MEQSYGQTHDGGADLEAHGGAAQTAATAGGAGDNTYVLGPVIDRMPPGAGGFMNAIGAVYADGVIGSAATMTIYSKFRHGDNSDGTTGWADYTPPNTGVVEATKVVADASSEDGVAEAGTLKHAVDLAGAARYIRHDAKVDLSASGTDTAVFHSMVFLGGKRGV